MNALMQDLKYAFRSLAKSPGFAAAAMLTLALGIGANTAIFSLVQAVLLKPLPFGDPERVVVVTETWKGYRGGVSAGNFEDLRRAGHSFERFAAVRYGSFNLAEAGEPERVSGARVTSDFFGVFGVAPLSGRVFRPEEDRPGAERVVILSHRLWASRFGLAADVQGRRVLLDGEPYTVIGVMPPRFDYTRSNEQLWVPAGFSAEVRASHDDHDLMVFGLLARGATVSSAEQESAAIMRELARRFPNDDADRGFRVLPLRDLLVEGYRGRLLILAGAVGLVLLIACTNVSNMLLARSSSRAREMTIRAALGASRLRIVRQTLTECAVLALAGGALGVALAFSAAQALVVASPPDVPRIEQAAIDGPALVFALALSLAASLGFGLLPAARAASLDLQAALRQGGRGAAGGRRRDRARTGLVAAQVALALTLLVGAGLLIRTAVHLQKVELGFDPTGVLAASVSLPRSAYANPDATAHAFERLAEEIETAPGVRSAAVTSQAPLGPEGNSNGLISEENGFDVTKAVDARLRIVTTGYFRTLGIRIFSGRRFGAEDSASSSRVMIVSRGLAERLWPGRNALGRRVACCEGSPGDPRWKTVVGIAGDVRSQGPGQDAYPEFYLPITQVPPEAWDWIQRTVAVVARASDGRATALSSSLRQAARQAIPSVPLYEVHTMTERLRGALAEQRFHTMLLVVLGAVGLLLAAIGISGVIAYFVAQRTAEFGVRIALGATRWDILAVAARQSLAPVGVGLAAGTAAALAVTRLLSASLRGVEPHDPMTFVSVVAILAGTAALATYLPARRAMRVDPATALRNE